ncbi:MAG: hypothetical protein IIC76_03750 [Bacteroidetes bacterium]|nr:hypothetical protein [Bacteroidota bacterium]
MQNILIIKFGALGDVVRTSYFIKPLHDKFHLPDIYWLTSPGSMGVLKFNPYIFKITDNTNDLTDIYFDWIISLDDEIEILKKIDKINYKKITGAHLLDSKVIYTDDSALWFNMGLISRLGKLRADQLKKENKLTHNEIFADILKIKDIHPIFYNSEKTEIKYTEHFKDEFFHIGINNSSGDRWHSKKMKLDTEIALIKNLLNLKIDSKKVIVHLLGGKEEKNNNHRILTFFSSSRKIIIEDTDQSILKFASVIKACNYIISSDSLALHLAIAQKIPNLSFYAPTSAAEIDTFGTGVKIKSTSEDYCSYKPDADNSTITNERILKAFKKHLTSLKLI